jgi:hypothetical protein
MLNVIMLNVNKLTVIMLSVIMLSVKMLSVTMLSVIMLNVMSRYHDGNHNTLAQLLLVTAPYFKKDFKMTV